jgi:hypothetical protein
MNSYVAYVCRRVLNSRYIKIWLESVKGLKRNNSYVAYVSRRVLNSRYTKFGWNRLRS